MIVTEDDFGLRLRQPLKLLQRRFDFMTRPQKIAAFKEWLAEQEALGLLQVTGGTQWSDEYIESAYKKGAARAYVQANKAKLLESSTIFAATQEQFVRTAFFQPETLQKVQLLNTRAFDQLKGISAAMDQQLSRIFSEGLVNGYGPEKIARNIDNAIARIDRTRARVLARTEIIHAHAEGQLDSYKTLGIDEVQAEVEWLTAGDERVCFPKFTQVKTETGDRPIQYVRVGDKVLTRQGHRKVTGVRRRRYRGTMRKIKTQTQNKLWCTDRHLLWDATCKNWVKAKHLNASDAVETVSYKNDRIDGIVDLTFGNTNYRPSVTLQEFRFLYILAWIGMPIVTVNFNRKASNRQNEINGVSSDLSFLDEE